MRPEDEWQVLVRGSMPDDWGYMWFGSLARELLTDRILSIGRRLDPGRLGLAPFVAAFSGALQLFFISTVPSSMVFA